MSGQEITESDVNQTPDEGEYTQRSLRAIRSVQPFKTLIGIGSMEEIAANMAPIYGAAAVLVPGYELVSMTHVANFPKGFDVVFVYRRKR